MKFKSSVVNRKGIKVIVTSEKKTKVYINKFAYIYNNVKAVKITRQCGLSCLTDEESKKKKKKKRKVEEDWSVEMLPRAAWRVLLTSPQRREPILRSLIARGSPEDIAWPHLKLTDWTVMRLYTLDCNLWPLWHPSCPWRLQRQNKTYIDR